MQKTNRRAFLSKAGLLGIGALSGAALLQACGGGEAKIEENSSPAPSPMAASEEAEAVAADCASHNAKLSESDLEVRKSIGYLEQSEMADQNCQNCRFYLADKFDGDCGGCQLFVNGSVNPDAWCKSWAAK